MTALRLDMTMSLDGFVAGPDDRPGQEMGRDGFRLFNVRVAATRKSRLGPTRF